MEFENIAAVAAAGVVEQADTTSGVVEQADTTSFPYAYFAAAAYHDVTSVLEMV